MSDADDIPRRWTLSSLAALVAIAVAPPSLCIWVGGVPWHIVAFGGAIWFASVCVKRLVLSLPLRRERLSRVTAATLHGALSAGVELGAAAIYLATFAPASMIEVIAFGAGAGSAEAAYVLLIGVLGARPDPAEIAAWARGAAVSWCVRYTVPIERSFALIGHIGARGLVYVALQSSSPIGALWLLPAVLLFTAIDGVAVYGHLGKWNWHDPSLCRRAHALFALLSVCEAILFLIAFPLAR
jgi:hypothetical protein